MTTQHPREQEAPETFKFIGMSLDAVNKLSVKRAQDREKMAMLVEDVVANCGATSSRTTNSLKDRTITIEVQGNRGLMLNFDIDGKSSLGDKAFVLPWHMAHDSDDRMAAGSFGGVVNTVHFRKATQVNYSFYAALHALKRGLEGAADGRIFQPRPEQVEHETSPRPRIRA